MSTEDKTLVQRIAEAASALPDVKREYILGYAEGVIAMRRQIVHPAQSAVEHAE